MSKKEYFNNHKINKSWLLCDFCKFKTENNMYLFNKLIICWDCWMGYCYEK